MIPTIILFVSLAISALFITVVFMFLSVVQTGPKASLDPRWRWRPPVVNGAKLMLWGAAVSEAVSKALLSKWRSKATPTKLASEVLTGASFAIKHLPLMSGDVDEGDCRHRKFERIGVTAPEILAIADQIRPNPEEAKRVHDIAQHNARQLVDSSFDGFEAASLVCPLRTNNDTCAAASLCPLHCRATCHLSGVAPENAKVLEVAARDLGFGIEVGLSRAMAENGLDGNVYELNSALAVALETPNASQRWANGEDVLVNCMHNEDTAYPLEFDRL